VQIEQAALYISIVSLLVTLSGWVVAYIFSNNTQNIGFRNSIRNEARKDILEAIYRHRALMVDISGWFNLPYLTSVREQTKPELLRELLDELAGLVYSEASYLWLRHLEDYASLFPETAEVREKILQLNRRFEGHCKRFLKRHSERDFENSANDRDLCDKLSLELLTLSEDMRVHILNLTFSKIVGVKIPLRVSRIENVAMIVQGADGNLKIVGDLTMFE
jgi:hypothetical protein